MAWVDGKKAITGLIAFGYFTAEAPKVRTKEPRMRDTSDKALNRHG
jgi:hypothetical protein